MLERKYEVKERIGKNAKSDFLKEGTDKSIQYSIQKDPNKKTKVCLNLNDLEPDNCPLTKDYLKHITKQPEVVVEQVLFNYNSVEPKIVSDNASIDYLKPLSAEEEWEKVTKEDSLKFNSANLSRLSSGTNNHLAQLRTNREQDFGQLFESTDEDEVTEAAGETSIVFGLKKTIINQQKEEAEQLMESG